jgi:hypothetical protein
MDAPTQRLHETLLAHARGAVLAVDQWERESHAVEGITISARKNTVRLLKGIVTAWEQWFKAAVSKDEPEHVVVSS